MQYEDDTLVYPSNIDLDIANKKLLDSVEKLASYFDRNSLKMNTSKRDSENYLTKCSDL